MEGLASYVVLNPKLPPPSRLGGPVPSTHRYDIVPNRCRWEWCDVYSVFVLRPSSRFIATGFDDSRQGTSGHYLLCFQEPSAHVVWLMTAAADSQRVFDYLLSLKATFPKQLAREHLSDLPFSVYVFKQERGDLVILPPRSYHQRFFEGTTASCCWSRMTVEGLRYAVFYDLHKRQR